MQRKAELSLRPGACADVGGGLGREVLLSTPYPVLMTPMGRRCVCQRPRRTPITNGYEQADFVSRQSLLVGAHAWELFRRLPLTKLHPHRVHSQALTRNAFSMRITARSLILLLPLVAIAAAAPAGPVGGVQALALRQDPSGTQSDPSANPTDPTDPGTTPTDPGTTPTDPGTTPTDPGTTPTDPGTTPTDPGTTPTTTDRPTQWFLTADNVAADNSTAHLTAAGQGAIAALGDFSASSGVRWTPELLEVGYKAAVGSDDALHTIGGGYTINTDGISVGAGIDFQDQGTSFSLNVGTNGTIVASVWGDNLTCTVDGNKAICSNA